MAPIISLTLALFFSHHVLCSEPKTQETQAPLTPSSFSLPLHPIAYLYHAQKKDIRSLLSRDSVRLSWIISKLQERNTPEYVSAPVTSGLSAGTGEYFARIGVGEPAQSFYLSIDTGSDLNWLQCKPCSFCYNQSDPVFDPSQSSSYTLLSCEAQLCEEMDFSTCTNKGQCGYEFSYWDGSFSQGVLATETMLFGNAGPIRVPLGCGHENKGLFVGAAGVLGLGRGPLSFPSQINATSFSYCMVPRDTNQSSTIDFNSPLPSDSVTAQLLTNPKLSTFYYVGATGVSVGGSKVPVPPSTFRIRPSGSGGIIMDSGTTLTWLQPDAYQAVRDAFVARTRHLPRAKAFLVMDTCYNLWNIATLTLPTVSFEMSDGRLWMLPSWAYMIPVDNNGTFCFSFASSRSSISIIGNVQQQGTRVHFDLANSVVGFLAENCG